MVVLIIEILRVYTKAYQIPSGTLEVQSTKTWGIYGFYIRNRNSGFGNLLCIRVLRPLGELCWYSIYGVMQDLYHQQGFLNLKVFHQSKWPLSQFNLGAVGG